jgi:hypothetical protein
MTPHALAQRLTGREIGREITLVEAAEAYAVGLVVVFGVSDDLLAFHGALDEEVSAWGGVEVLITRDGIWQEQSCPDKCRHYRQAKEAARKNGVIVRAIWGPGDGYSWKISTLLRGTATFEILDHGEPYCQGVVFSMAEVAAVAAERGAGAGDPGSSERRERA